MPSPYFNSELRKKSMELAESANLEAELVAAIFAGQEDRELADFETLAIPTVGTPEHTALKQMLRPFAYALYSRVISELLTRDDLDRRDYSADRLRPASDLKKALEQIDMLLRSKYHNRLATYWFDTEPEPREVKLLDQIAKITSQDDANAVVMSGVNSMAHSCTNLLGVYLRSPKLYRLDRAEKESVARASYGELIEMANHDPVHLFANQIALQEGSVVAAVSTNQRLKITPPVEDTPVSDSSKQQMLVHFDKFSPEKIMSFRNVGDAASGRQVIGCPILFRRGQVKKIWNETIDLAVDFDLLG